jgi:hypothetical protein
MARGTTGVSRNPVVEVSGIGKQAGRFMEYQKNVAQ